MSRADHRLPEALRPVRLIPGYVSYPEGSVLIEMGETRVLCNASITEGVPRWMQIQNVSGGWITAEYALLPRATQTRTQRETNGLTGRTQEIRRLIGRSLRAAVDLEKLGSRTCILDCDVLQADGGTRTASITGGYVALMIALHRLIQAGEVPPETHRTAIAAVSAGVVKGQPLLDLDYAEDSQADADMNVVMNLSGEFIEIQGTAERAPFSRSKLNQLLSMAQQGIQELLAIQKSCLDRVFQSNQ
jgi:ribonuclease PH